MISLYLEPILRAVVLFAFFLGIPGLISYLLYKNIKGKKSPLLAGVFALFLVGYIYTVSNVFAAVKANYAGQNEWGKNRNYYYTLFLEKLKKTSNIRESASAMLTSSVKEKMIHYQRFLLLPFKVRGALFLVCGGFLLFFSFASLFIIQFRIWKHYMKCFWAAFLPGLILLFPGVHQSSYASSMQKKFDSLNNVLYEDMKELSMYKGQYTAPELISFTEEYIKNARTFDLGQCFFTEFNEAEKLKKQ